MAESGSTMQRTFHCTFKNCPASFRTKALLRRHKLSNPEHNYCKPCDLDFPNEETLIAHKVQSDQHIVCPACGEEFRSDGGLRLHVEQMHGAKQQIACAGCGDLFGRAGALMAHIEHNGCKKIKPIEFQAHRARREVLNRFLADPEGFQANAASEAAESIAEDENGVQLTEPSLLDSDEAPTLKEEALQPEKAKQQEWPDLDTVAYHKGTEDTEDLLTGLRTLSSREPSDVWGGEPSAGSLFPDAIKNYVPPIVEEADESSRSPCHAAWDPNSSSFKPEVFYQKATNKYHCPHPRCRMSFRNAEGFKQHLNSDSHLPERVTCPCCFKQFKSTAALVQHCESPSTRCRIRSGDNYNKALGTLTGGLIETSGTLEDGTVKYRSVEPTW